MTARQERQARETFAGWDAAKEACYWRLHPKPHIDTSKGARLLYDAVCEAWLLAVREAK